MNRFLFASLILFFKKKLINNFYFILLFQVEKCRSMDTINVEDLLQDMRYYRMGLIQTPDQLRFSYLSVIEGGKHILSNLPPLEDDPLVRFMYLLILLFFMKLQKPR